MDNSNEEAANKQNQENEMKETLFTLLSYNKYITKALIDDIYDNIKIQTFAKGEIIYKKGQGITDLSILIQGRVGMFKSVYNRDIDDKEEILVQEFQRGGILGYKNLTQGMTFNDENNYICQSYCQIVIINQDQFETYLKKPLDQFFRETILFLKEIPLFNCISYNKLQQNSYYISVYQAQRGQIIYSAEESHRDFYVLLNGSVAVSLNYYAIQNIYKISLYSEQLQQSYQKIRKRTLGFTQLLQQLGDDEDLSTQTLQSTQPLESSPARSYRQTERIAKIREYHQGQYFGELEIIHNKKRLFTLISESTSVILRFTPYLFNKLIKEDPECWNILQDQASFKEEIIRQRNEKFQASLKIVNENNDLISKPIFNSQISSLKNAQQRVLSHKIQQSLIKLSQQTLQTQTDDSVSMQSKQDLQSSTLSPRNPRNLKRQDSLAKYQSSLILQNSMSRLIDGQQSTSSISQLSPHQIPGKRNLSMIPLQNLNTINENDTAIPFLKMKKQSLQELDVNQLNQLTQPSNQETLSPIQVQRKKKSLSLHKQFTTQNMQTVQENQTEGINSSQVTQNGELQIPIRMRYSSMTNFQPMITPTTQLSDQTQQYFTNKYNNKPNTRQDRRSVQKERISSQDYLDTNQFSAAIFNESAIESMSDLLKFKLFSGPWSNRVPQKDLQNMEDNQKISNQASKLKLPQQGQTDRQTKPETQRVGIIDKHTENFAQNLKNVFYRVLNKKNISKEDTQKGLEKQVIDEGIKKYITIHSSIQNRNKEYDYLKEKRLKYNDQLANVIYGRVKNYIERKNNEDDQISHTPRLISYKSPSDLFQGQQQSVSEQINDEMASQANNNSQIKFPFTLTPQRFRPQNKNSMNDFTEDKEDTSSSISPHILNLGYKQSQDLSISPIHLDKRQLFRLSPSPQKKQQANITQQIYPLGVGSCNTERNSHKSFSPKIKATLSRKSPFRNEKLIPSLKMDPSTQSLLKRHELNASLKVKFKLGLNAPQPTNNNPQLQQGEIFKVTSLKNLQPTLPTIQTIKYNSINNY